MSYQDMYEALLEAIQQGPHRQQELVRATEEAYAYLEELGAELEGEQVLGIRILLAQAETLIGRYFGM